MKRTAILFAALALLAAGPAEAQRKGGILRLGNSHNVWLER